MTSLTWDRHRGDTASGYDVVELGFNYRSTRPEPR